MDQKYTEFVKTTTDQHLEYINRRKIDNIQVLKDLTLKCSKIFLGELEFDSNTLSMLKTNEFSDTIRFFENVIFLRGGKNEIPNPFSVSHPIIQKLIHADNLGAHHNLDRLIKGFITNQLTLYPNLDNNAFLQFLYKQKFTDQKIITLAFEYAYTPLFYQQSSYRFHKNKSSQPDYKLTKFGEYLLNMIKPQKGFLGFKKDSGLKAFVDDLLMEKRNNNGEQILDWLSYLYKYYPESLADNHQKYLTYKDYQNKNYINFDCVYFLIEHEAAKFDKLFVSLLDKVQSPVEIQMPIYIKLNEKLNGKYHDKIVQLGEEYYNTWFKKTTATHAYYYDRSTTMGQLSIVYGNYLIQYNKDTAKERILRFIHESDFILPHFIKYLDGLYGAYMVPHLIDALFKFTDKNDYYTTIFSILEKYNFNLHFERFLDFMINVATAKTRQQSAVLIAKYQEEISSRAIELVTGKTVNQRITGALILSAINSEKSNAILNEAVDQEINDDTRDIMLEALLEKRFAKAYSLSEVKDMVEKAEARKKLSKWTEKWIEEEKLPKLYWLGGKKELTTNEVRFLIYRMKRAKGLNSDIEAKQMLNHIDKELASGFAKVLLLAFQDSNADPKFKYYLTISGLLGNDEIMHNLNTLFKKNMADKRMKMAEYVIGALAMVGTNKALRIVEVIYRKFINKKPAISLAAKEALTAAATELSISMDELADRIIPNFDFDGLYKTFDVDGEEYRAFISADFTLNFLNEDNKIRKSVPPNTPKELKTEFKEIEKEIRDIVKSQSDRLEKYMLDERRWPFADWQNFFFMNPIMFVYALKLIWGVFDKNNKLVGSFYCSEDTSLYNINDEEQMIDEEHFIGILHPVYLSNDDLKQWHDKVYDMQMATIFPIFERTIFTIEESEKEQNFTRYFHGKAVGKGADFVNTFLVKKNWLKSSGDGGSSEFSKYYQGGELKAHANIEGPMAFYMGGNTPATVYEINFMRKNWSDKVKLQELPAIFYSEVMWDIDQLINAV